VRLDEAVCRVQDIQATVRHRHGPVHAATALLEGFEDDGLAGEIDAAGRERQGLADAAARIVQDQAEGADLARGVPGRFEEGPALGGGQV